MRAAIYARFSSDKQSETSLDDQVSICQSRAQREGWQVVATHTDNAISGSTQVSARPGGKGLLADVLASRFDVLVLESLDRLSRDQVEQESVVRRLEHRGVRIICVADGYDSEHSGRKVMRGVRGLINELYLDDLRHKTQRGMHGQVDRGYVAGGKSYGYDLVREGGGSRYVINELEAHWVRWIFEQVARGRAYRHIVYELNEKGVSSPRGSSWAVSALYGNPQKGSGLVNNALYVGQYIWYRSQWLKDPDTGKRQRIERPRHEWREAELPHLRIIDDALWQQVRARLDEGRDEFGRKRKKRPASTMLSGILRCPHCGGPMVAVNGVSYGCNLSHDRGPTVCKGFTLKKTLVEKRLLSAVRDQLLSDDAAAAFELLVAERIEAIEGSNSHDALVARKGILQGEVQRLVDAIAQVGLSPAIQHRLRMAERELAAIDGEIQQQRTASAPPNIRQTFRTMLMDLSGALKASHNAARPVLANILGEVEIELKGKEIWAHIATGPALRMAVGTDVYNTGCGGRI